MITYNAPNAPKPGAAHDNAVRLMMRLTTAIVDHSGAAMRSSAEVCLADAEACYDRGDYDHAQQRARKGLQYLIGFGAFE